MARDKKIRIGSDSRATLSATFPLVGDCKMALDKLPSNNSVPLLWVRVYTEVKGNEKADQLDRQWQ